MSFISIVLFSFTIISCHYNPFAVPTENTEIPERRIIDTIFPNLRCLLKIEQVYHEGYTEKGNVKEPYGPIFGPVVSADVIGKGGTILYQNTPLKTGYNTSQYYLDNSYFETPDGNFRVWRVGNSEAMPAFTDSIKSSTTQIKMSSPLNASDVSKSSPLKITWNKGKDSTDMISLWMYSVHDTSSVIIRSFADSGSFTLPLSTISRFPEGQTFIEVFCGHKKIGSVGNNKYELTYHTEHNININLVK